MKITLQSNEGLCWFSSVLFLLEQLDYSESPNVELVTCLQEISKAKRLQKTKKRKINKMIGNKFTTKKTCLFEYQAYILNAIDQSIHILNQIRPHAPDMKWNLRALNQDMPTEYALLCLLHSLGFHSNLNTRHIEDTNTFESYHHPCAKYVINSIYFDNVGVDVQKFVKESDTKTFELTVDIGMPYLHSIILTEVCGVWYILDPNIGTLTIDSLVENEFKRKLISVFQIDSEINGVTSQSEYINLKGILFAKVI